LQRSTAKFCALCLIPSLERAGRPAPSLSDWCFRSKFGQNNGERAPNAASAFQSTPRTDVNREASTSGPAGGTGHRALLLEPAAKQVFPGPLGPKGRAGAVGRIGYKRGPGPGVRALADVPMTFPRIQKYPQVVLDEVKPHSLVVLLSKADDTWLVGVAEAVPSARYL
jgi:hypothetical protein